GRGYHQSSVQAHPDIPGYVPPDYMQAPSVSAEPSSPDYIPPQGYQSASVSALPGAPEYIPPPASVQTQQFGHGYGFQPNY
ncbi:MAG: hypothetical protein EZS28_034147, partial [Streblomastix strix]